MTKPKEPYWIDCGECGRRRIYLVSGPGRTPKRCTDCQETYRREYMRLLMARGRIAHNVRRQLQKWLQPRLPERMTKTERKQLAEKTATGGRVS